MWMVSPKKLCKQHLLGEHFEIHCAVGNLKHTGNWTRGLTKKGFLVPKNFKKRHQQLVDEMIRRGYKHNSPLKTNTKLVGKVNTGKSIIDLRNRCKNCKV